MSWLKHVLDNIKLVFGTGKDSSMFYDGTDLNINPKEVGSGKLKILGDVIVEGNTYLKKGVRHSVTAVIATTYTILQTDYFLDVSTTSAGDVVTITLPDASTSESGKVFVIKDIDDDRNITLDTTGADTIDGVDDITFKGLSAVSVYSDGTSDWRIF